VLRSVVASEGESVGVHLNPVRAGICPLSALKGYALSSYPKYFKRKVRDGLCRGDFLSILGEPDSPAGMRRYAEHLELREEGAPKRREELAKRYCRGWFIGEKEEKKTLEKDLREKHPDVVWEGSELKELNEAMWGRGGVGREGSRRSRENGDGPAIRSQGRAVEGKDRP